MKKFKLLQAYPGFEEVGSTHEFESVQAKQVIAKWSNYWEEIRDPKDFEVLSFAGIKSGTVYFEDRKYDHHHNPKYKTYFEEYAAVHNRNVYKIHSVKRTSDDQVFQLGCWVRNPKNPAQEFQINSFYLDAFNEHMLVGPGHIGLRKVEKIPQEELDIRYMTEEQILKTCCLSIEEIATVFVSADKFKEGSNCQANELRALVKRKLNLL